MNINNFLELLTISPNSYIALTLRKLDCNIFNIPDSDKSDLINNLAFYICDKLVTANYPVTMKKCKQIAVCYIIKFRENEINYLKK